MDKAGSKAGESCGGALMKPERTTVRMADRAMAAIRTMAAAGRAVPDEAREADEAREEGAARRAAPDGARAAEAADRKAVARPHPAWAGGWAAGASSWRRTTPAGNASPFAEGMAPA